MAHTVPDVTFVLHRTRIGKGETKKIGIDCQWGDEFIFIFLFNFLIRKAAMNALPL
jgi:hypothetical protein